jgi:hypothetical protein
MEFSNRYGRIISLILPLKIVKVPRELAGGLFLLLPNIRYCT